MNLSEVKVIVKYFRPGDNLYPQIITVVDGKRCICFVDAENHFQQEENRPAVVAVDEQYFVFWNSRNLHRTDGPAIIEPWGGDRLRLRWFHRGKLKRDNCIDMRPIPADLFKSYHEQLLASDK